MLKRPRSSRYYFLKEKASENGASCHGSQILLSSNLADEMSAHKAR
jgi:hypothetical protein